MLDIQKSDFNKSSEAGFEFEVKLPTGEATGAFVKVRGVQSPTVKAFSRRKYSEMESQRQMARRRGKDMPEMTLEEAEDAVVESAVVRTIGWRGLTNGTSILEFSKENAAELFRNHDWIRAQVMEASDDILNFRPV